MIRHNNISDYSHRSNLLRKDAFYYDHFGWVEGPGLPYYWPSNV